MLDSCLNGDPENRPSMSTLFDILSQIDSLVNLEPVEPLEKDDEFEILSQDSSETWIIIKEKHTLNLIIEYSINF